MATVKTGRHRLSWPQNYPKTPNCNQNTQKCPRFTQYRLHPSPTLLHFYPFFPNRVTNLPNPFPKPFQIETLLPKTFQIGTQNRSKMRHFHVSIRDNMSQIETVYYFDRAPFPHLFRTFPRRRQDFPNRLVTKAAYGGLFFRPRTLFFQISQGLCIYLNRYKR